MNESKDLLNSYVCGTTVPSPTDRGMTMVYFAAAAVVCFIVVQLSLSWIYANAKIIWLFIATVVSTPTKFVTFILLGQAPLRYFGYLDDFPISSVIRMACIGGFSFVIPHFIYDVRTPAAEPEAPLTEEEEFNRRKKGIRLDRALQEKVTVLLVREINQTALVVLVGVLVMRLMPYHNYIDGQLFELLMTTALFGPTIFFASFISLTAVLFGVRWGLQRFRNWWHGWASTW